MKAKYTEGEGGNIMGDINNKPEKYPDGEIPVKNIFGGSDLVFLVTEMKDNDKIVKSISEQTYANNPGIFEGDDPYAYYKMKYVPPYDSFGELRHLILRIKNSTGLRYEFKGIVAIDLFEWLGHENDEYFDVTLKFLYDHRNIWKYIFTFKDAPAEKLNLMYDRAINFFRIMIIDKCLFNHMGELKIYLRDSFDKQNVRHDASAIDMLAGIFSDKDAKNIKSYEKINMIVQDIADNSPDKIISDKIIAKNLGENRLVLNMLLNKNLIQKIITERTETTETTEITEITEITKGGKNERL